MVNIRTKGQGGEREICTVLNLIYCAVLRTKNIPAPEDCDLPFQRNQNQSAVGGSDISNPFGFEIEVKRQETLAIESWWKQCKTSAQRTGGRPVLIYRQNRRSWRVVLETQIVTTSGKSIVFPSDIAYDSFLKYVELELLDRV